MKKQDIISSLNHFAAVYHDQGAPAIDLIICGGAALNLLGLVERTTKDIDLLAPQEWSHEFSLAVKATRDHFNLPDNWMNTGPASLNEFGLPKDFMSRCEAIDFNQSVRALLTSRYDQIHFKLYASLDRGGYHLQDLSALNPTNDEIFAATQWILTHDSSEGFELIIKSFLELNGWNNVKNKIFNTNS